MKRFSLASVVRSMIPSKRLIGVFQGIAANTAPVQTVVLQTTAAWNFVDMWFVMANLLAVNIQEIRLKIGGNIMQRWNGTDLDGRLQYDRQPASATNSILKLPMRRMGIRGGMSYQTEGGIVTGSARDLAYETTLNCGSAGGGFGAIVDVQIELDIINTGAPQPRVALYGRVTPPVPGGPGLVYRTDKQSKTITNGTVTITKSEMGLDALRPYLNRIVLVNPDAVNGTFDNFLLRYQNNDWWQVSAALLRQGQTEDDLRTPNAPTQYVIDFQEEGFGDTVLDVSNPNSDVLLQFDVAGLLAAGNMTFYLESAGLPFAANA